jgi:hypothetical protein
MALTNEGGSGDEIILGSKSLSIDITKLKTSGNNVFGIKIPTVVVGNFTGVMIQEYIEEGEVIESAHTVQGDFEYYSE